MQTLIEFNDQALETLGNVEGLTNVSSNLTDSDTILRVDGQPAVRFSGELESEDSLGVTAQAKTALVKVAPASVTISEGFETQAQTEGFSGAVSSILIAIVAVYIVMVFTFRSFVHPFTILFSLPMAMIGVALAPWMTGSVVGISALVGVMMLVGIVVTNAIVLIDRVQVNRNTARPVLVERMARIGWIRKPPPFVAPTKSDLPLGERWKALEPYWEGIRSTGYGTCLRFAIRVLFGVQDLNGATYAQLSDAIAASRRAGWYRHVLKEVPVSP